MNSFVIVLFVFKDEYNRGKESGWDGECVVTGNGGGIGGERGRC